MAHRPTVLLPVHGYDVPADVVKRAMRRAGLDQNATAARLNVHQTTVSHYYTGRRPPHPDFLALVETVITSLAAVALSRAHAAQTPAQQTPAPQPIQSVPQVHAQQTPAQQTPAQQTPAQQTPAQQTPAQQTPDPYMAPGNNPKRQPFPADRAIKLANMTRQAMTDGSITSVFGFRKLLVWAQAYTILTAAGAKSKDALGGAYFAAVVAKTVPGSEDRRFASESFFQEFGYLPESAALPAADGQHPVEATALPFVLARIPVWLHGSAGTGKTYSAVSIAKTLDRPYMRVQGSGDLTMEHLLGGQGARNGSTIQHYGPLPLMMQAGGVLILDEPSVCPPEILMELQAVLEGEPLLLKGAAPELIQPADGFTVICCDNTTGNGEGVMYAGTRPMNAAFLDRFVMFEYGFMSPLQEKVILDRALSDSVARWNADMNADGAA